MLHKVYELSDHQVKADFDNRFVACHSRAMDCSSGAMKFACGAMDCGNGAMKFACGAMDW